MQVHWRVKPAEEHDRDVLINLWHQFMNEEHEQEMTLAQWPSQTSLKNWVARLDRQIQQGKITVILKNQTIVGFIGMIDYSDKDWVPAHVAYVVDIYMLPHARSFAAFKQLINGFSEQVKDRYTQVWTNIASSKHRVGALLSRLGFAVLPDIEVQGLEDQCYLSKTIRQVDPRDGAANMFTAMMSGK